MPLTQLIGRWITMTFSSRQHPAHHHGLQMVFVSFDFLDHPSLFSRTGEPLAARLKFCAVQLTVLLTAQVLLPKYTALLFCELVIHSFILTSEVF